MYKSIWLAAGLQYEARNEETGVELQNNDRGMVERLTPFMGQPYLPPGTNARRLSRALILETTIGLHETAICKAHRSFRNGKAGEETMEGHPSGTP
eukprot:4061681-Amphidinium_carterae.1